MNTATAPARPASAHIDDTDVENLPPVLREMKICVCWAWRWKPAKGKGKSKWDKPPIDPATGIEVDATDEANWMTLDEARRAAREHGHADGVGIAMGSEAKGNRTGIVGVDPDDCIDAEGNIDRDVMRIVGSLDSYTERTPSGRGLRVLLLGRKPGPRCKNTRRDIEIYDSDRYFTLTGRHLEGTPTNIRRNDEALKALYDELFPAADGQGRQAGGAGPTSPLFDASDDELLRRARAARSGAKFTALFDRGDVSAYGDDDSSADMALMNMLAYWTSRDASRMEAIFGRSALGQRDKWRHRADYRQRTIDRAIANCKEVYTPAPLRNNGKYPTATPRSAPPSDGSAAAEPTDGSAAAEDQAAAKKTSPRDRSKDPREIPANFTARIVATIIRHDGNTQLTRYRIVACHEQGHEREITIDAEKYAAMTWVYNLGGEFAMDPGREVKDLVRQGIQVRSIQDGIARVVQHTALGWIQVDGRWLYRHSGGAIGADGPSDAVAMDVSPSLARYRLPPVPDRTTLQQAVDRHLDIWKLGRDGHPGGRAVAAVVATLPWRAVLGPFDASAHFGGPSGNRKTSSARLVYQHFADVQGRNSPMPADWRSTANALQRLAFDCRDAALVIDDLKFDDQVKTAEVLMHAQGNLMNKLRMNVNQSLQPVLDPRGSVLSTGELDPRTRSTRGRILMVEIGADDINLDALTRLQEAGDGRLFSGLMAAYVQSLAARLDNARKELRERVAAETKAIGDIAGAHARQPDIIGQLVAGYRPFLDWCVAAELLAPITATATIDQARRWLIELGTGQAIHQEEARPGRQYLNLLASSLQAGRCHLLDAHSDAPPADYPSACGWRWESTRDGGEWQVSSSSRCVGFISKRANLVYLDPEASQDIVVNLARSLNNLQSFANIGRELAQEGLIQADPTPGKYARQKWVRNANRRMYWVPTQNLFNPEGAPAETEGG
jgi:primase-polymerase (primpol)-like protein